MWFFKKIFWMLVLPFVALTGVLMFAFPEEMKEFKKDLVDMIDNNWMRGIGFTLFVSAATLIAGIFDGKHTMVRCCSKD